MSFWAHSRSSPIIMPIPSAIVTRTMELRNSVLRLVRLSDMGGRSVRLNGHSAGDGGDRDPRGDQEHQRGAHIGQADACVIDPSAPRRPEDPPEAVEGIHDADGEPLP